ncbi:MAG: hypothetical protein LBQ47_03815 [Endomicrobium sp.]|jgi:hypothetical protein|nr:hypothetical protein [Endomicrobium sp.]
MLCKYPISVKSEFGYIDVGCGKCLPCKIRRTQEWSRRLKLEAIYHKQKCFITLTYNDESLPANFSLEKAELQKFFKRLRKRVGSFRYFAVGEYGEKRGRPHYHAILFGVGTSHKKAIAQSWSNGFIKVDGFTSGRAGYVAKYCCKLYDTNDNIRAPQFTVMSRNPGIGYRYVDDNYEFMRLHYGMVSHGRVVNLPRYFMRRVYPQSKVSAFTADVYRRLVSRHIRISSTMHEIEFMTKNGCKNRGEMLLLQREQSRQFSLNIEAKYKLKHG